MRTDDGHYGRPDVVDYERDLIVDLKPRHPGETDDDILVKYQDQFDKYVELYEKARGIKPQIVLRTYDVS